MRSFLQPRMNCYILLRFTKPSNQTTSTYLPFNIIVTGLAGLSFLWCLSLFTSQPRFSVCDPIGSPLESSSLNLWPPLWCFTRTLQLFESFYHIRSGKQITTLHIFHHISMVWTSWIWILWPTSFFIYVGILNSLDNFLLYGKYSLIGLGISGINSLNWLTKLSGILEGFFGAMGFILFCVQYFNEDGCERSWAILLTCFIHGSLGIFRDLHRLTRTTGPKER